MSLGRVWTNHGEISLHASRSFLCSSGTSETTRNHKKTILYFLYKILNISVYSVIFPLKGPKSSFKRHVLFLFLLLAIGSTLWASKIRVLTDLMLDQVNPWLYPPRHKPFPAASTHPVSRPGYCPPNAGPLKGI